MSTSAPLRFDEPELLAKLATMPANELDALKFGVIGFGHDPDACVQFYSAYEAKRSGLDPAGVLGLPFFSVVAQCMNNYLVAQRFEDARLERRTLDETLDYVLTVRMRPSSVMLRLLAAPDRPLRYVVVDWLESQGAAGDR